MSSANGAGCGQGTDLRGFCSRNKAVSMGTDITFVIGGSLGLDSAVLKRADTQISFGKFTLPHQLMRLVLTEQIYRAFMINEGSLYHK